MSDTVIRKDSFVMIDINLGKIAIARFAKLMCGENIKNVNIGT